MSQPKHKSTESGFTLIELMVVMLIIGVLMTQAVPRYTSAIKNAKEAVLKEDLHVIRNAIDSYTMDKQKAPQSLQDLVEGGYLKSIPVDPMTGKAEWGLRSMQDDPDSDSYGGQSVFDVYSKSDGTALDGTKYKDW